MTLTLTRRAMRYNFDKIISIGDREARALLEHQRPFAKSRGSWTDKSHCYYYIVGGVLISTGNRPLANKDTTVDLEALKDYEQEAENILAYPKLSYENKKTLINKVLSEFVSECTNEPEMASMAALGTTRGVLVIPEGTTEIEAFAFYGRKDIDTVVFPQTLKTIDFGAFYRCPNIKTVELASTLNIPLERVFRDCNNLTIVTNESVRNQESKADAEKLRCGLIPPEALEALAEVLTYGADKYGGNTWKDVEIERYIGAMLRHLIAWQKGEVNDSESGIEHLKHMFCNAMFIMCLGKEAFQLKRGKKAKRLTEYDEFDNADIIGVDSWDLQMNLEFKEFNLVTDALNKLAAYEDIDELEGNNGE